MKIQPKISYALILTQKVAPVRIEPTVKRLWILFLYGYIIYSYLLTFLANARITDSQLATAWSLSIAVLPDGTWLPYVQGEYNPIALQPPITNLTSTP